MKRYDKHFKEEAARLVLELRRSVASVAKELGIHETTLHKWVNQYGNIRFTNLFINTASNFG